MTINSYTFCYFLIDLPSIVLEKLSILAYSLSIFSVSDSKPWIVIFSEIVIFFPFLPLVLGTRGPCTSFAFFFCSLVNVLAVFSALAVPLAFLSLITYSVVIILALLNWFQSVHHEKFYCLRDNWCSMGPSTSQGQFGTWYTVSGTSWNSEDGARDSLR